MDREKGRSKSRLQSRRPTLLASPVDTQHRIVPAPPATAQSRRPASSQRASTAGCRPRKPGASVGGRPWPWDAGRGRYAPWRWRCSAWPRTSRVLPAGAAAAGQEVEAVLASEERVAEAEAGAPEEGGAEPATAARGPSLPQDRRISMGAAAPRRLAWAADMVERGRWRALMSLNVDSYPSCSLLQYRRFGCRHGCLGRSLMGSYI